MDAVKFLEERKRMAENGELLPDIGVDLTYNSDKIVQIVEEWAATHPHKTRQSVFLEQWPGAEIDKRGRLMLCPKLISDDYRNKYAICTNRLCADCRREFWMKEVEEDK